jgi:hypothetical protein
MLDPQTLNDETVKSQTSKLAYSMRRASSIISREAFEESNGAFLLQNFHGAIGNALQK